jgi:hypothetical protein
LLLQSFEEVVLTFTEDIYRKPEHQKLTREYQLPGLFLSELGSTMPPES